MTDVYSSGTTTISALHYERNSSFANLCSADLWTISVVDTRSVSKAAVRA